MIINGLEFIRCNNETKVRFPSQAGIREATIPSTDSIKTVSLPYRDKAKPIWYVDVNKKKLKLA